MNQIATELLPQGLQGLRAAARFAWLVNRLWALKSRGPQSSSLYVCSEVCANLTEHLVANMQH